MRETVVTAMTKIDELLSKREQIHDRTASIISDVVIGRVESDKLNSTQTINEITNMVSKFSKEEQVEILKRVVTDVASNLSPNRNNKKDSYSPMGFKKSDRSSLFR